MNKPVWIPGNPQATRAPTDGRGNGGAPPPEAGGSRASETTRSNRAQLIVGGAVALVLVGTTAFVLLRETAPTPPEAPQAVTIQPAPTVPPAVLPIPAPTIVAPPVAPPPAVTPQPAPPPASAPPVTEPKQAEAVPASKRHKAAVVEQAAGKAAFTLQLDSFLIPSNATALIARINEHGGSAYDKVEPDPDGKAWHKVRSGSYDSEAEAEAAAEDLKRTEGIDALVVQTTVEDAK